MAKRKKFKPYTFRHRYNYICTGCGKKRTSLDHDRMKLSICTNCELQKVDENQATLFNQ